MGANSQYSSVPQSDDTDLEQRPAKVRAQDFRIPGTAAALDDEEDIDADGFGPRRRGGRRQQQHERPPLSWYTLAKRTLYLVVLVTLALGLGFCAGSKHQQMKGCGSGGSSKSSGHAQLGEEVSEGGLLPPQSLVPESRFSPRSFSQARSFQNQVLTLRPIVPMKGVKFGFPTPYEDTDIAGDKLWDALMPRKYTHMYHPTCPRTLLSLSLAHSHTCTNIYVWKTWPQYSSTK